MKHRILMAVGMISIGVQTHAYADVGPSPICPSGQHSEYLQGRRCVPDGSHLVKGPNGEITTEPLPSPKPASSDAAAPMPAPTTTATSAAAATATTPTATPTASTERAPMPATVEPKRNSGCSQADAGNASDVLGLLTVLALVLVSRKRTG